MTQRFTNEQVSAAFARLSPAEKKSIVWEVIISPEWIANSSEILKEFRECGVAGAGDGDELSLFVYMLEKSSDIARYLYGKAADRKSVITLAEEVKFCRNLNPDQASKSEIKVLTRFLKRVKYATDNLDVEFFRDLSEAVDLVRAAQLPPGSREALYVARYIHEVYINSGLEPTKADIKREVIRIMKIVGRRGGSDNKGATVLWQRDVWKHPEFSLVKERTKGHAPIYLPEIWYLRNK